MAEEGLWKTLEALLRRYGITEKIREQLIVVEWASEAPPIAQSAKPLYVKEGVLHLGVHSHTLAQELHLQKAKLIRDLRERGYAIDDIKFQVIPPEPASFPARLEIEITSEDRLWAHKALEGQDLPPRLRERMVSLLATARARERAMLLGGARRCRGCGAAFFGEGDLCPVCHVWEVEGAQEESFQ